MMRNVFSIVLIYLLASSAVIAKPGFAHSESEKQDKQAIRVKEGILRLGVGKDAHVSVKLRDKTKLVGYISRSDDDSFVITEETGHSTTVTYTSVAQVQGRNLSSGARIVIVAAIIVGLFVFAILISART